MWGWGFQTHSIQQVHIHVCVQVFGAAFFGLSPFPVAYEMACEVLFPIHEAIASCVMTVIAQWLSIVMTAVEYWAIKDKV